MEFSHYEAATPKLQQDLTTAYRRRHTEENEQWSPGGAET
jgi:hypothetical protein